MAELYAAKVPAVGLGLVYPIASAHADGITNCNSKFPSELRYSWQREGKE